MPEAPDALSEFRRRHIGRALARARWTFEERFTALIRARGFEDFRASDVEIIARLPADRGARVTELAERSKVSKQAIGKLVKGLEARGYVARHPDPDDGRAVRIVLSARGREFLEAAMQVVEQIEAQWLEVLGARGLEEMRRGLLKVSDALGADDYL